MCGQHVPLPRHGLKAEGVISASLGEKISPIPPLSQSGKSVWDSGTNPFWGERRARRWGDDNAPQRGPGAQPRHAFGSFRRETKGTPGVGRVGPLVGAGAASPAKSPRGAGRSARIRRRRDHVPASIPPGAEAPPFYKNPASKQNTRCGIEKTINPPSGSGQSSKKINTLCPR